MRWLHPLPMALRMERPLVHWRMPQRMLAPVAHHVVANRTPQQPLVAGQRAPLVLVLVLVLVPVLALALHLEWIMSFPLADHRRASLMVVKATVCRHDQVS